MYNDVEIPFLFEDYIKVSENAYFTTEDGKRGRLTSLNWVIEQDIATVSYWVEEVYTKNLEETFYEAA